jgi:hypothetical protein
MDGMIHEVIPDQWLGFGRCVRRNYYELPDERIEPSHIDEFYFQIKFPWKRRLYSINQDDVVVGHPVFILRFKPGWIISDQKVREKPSSDETLNHIGNNA